MPGAVPALAAGCVRVAFPSLRRKNPGRHSPLRRQVRHEVDGDVVLAGVITLYIQRVNRRLQRPAAR